MNVAISIIKSTYEIASVVALSRKDITTLLTTTALPFSLQPFSPFIIGH